MMHQAPRFKFIDRAFKEDMLLMPGWATDWRIFEKLDIPFNYFLPEDILTGDITDIFNNLPDRIRLSGAGVLGWSMGGFIAADLVSRYPSIFDKVVLVSVRRRYGENDIIRIGDYLRRNTKAYLRRFYGNLFSETEKGHRGWFEEGLLKQYLGDSDSLRLFDGLNYLAGRELKVGSSDSSNIIFVHGENDGIAPVEDARAVAAGIPSARFISIKGACHFPLLTEAFRDIFKLKLYAG